MLSRSPWLALLAFAATCFAACAPISFGKQELVLRHDAKADVLDLLIVYDEIESSGAQHDESFGFATRVSSGKREFMLYDWPMHFDLEGIAKQVAEEADRKDVHWRDWRRDTVKAFSSAKFNFSGYFADANGRLGLFQGLHVADVSHWISLFERALYIAIEASVAGGTFESDFALLDAHSRELWIAMAKNKRSWLALQEGSLVVDLPLSGADASGMIAKLLKQSRGNDELESFVAGVASRLTELHIADEHVVLRLKLDSPTITFAGKQTQSYVGTLARSLRESGALPEALLSREKVLERFAKH